MKPGCYGLKLRLLMVATPFDGAVRGIEAYDLQERKHDPIFKEQEKVRHTKVDKNIYLITTDLI